MRNLKRLAVLTALALAAVALTAGSASADIVNKATQETYVGEVEATNTGANPTLQAGSVTVTCTSALMGGFDVTPSTIDGTAPATGEFDFRWSGCTAALGVQSCTVNDVLDVSVAINEGNAPDSTIVNTERGETHINCTGGIFTCDAAADPDTFPVTAEVDSDTQVATIDDTVEVTGDTGCPGSGQWKAQYLITTPSDGLEATG